MSPIMAKIIQWNVPGLYQQKTRRFLKKIVESPNILTRNENGEAVIYGNAIPGSNFKSLFKSMVSNQQDLHQIGIDEFLRGLRSFGVNKDEISGEHLKISSATWLHISLNRLTHPRLSLKRRSRRRNRRKSTTRRK